MTVCLNRWTAAKKTTNLLPLSDDLFERLDDSEKNAEKIAYESRTYLADAWHRFRQNKLAFVGFCFLMFMLLCAIIIPMISPYTYDGQNLELRNIGPSLQHLMGTDSVVTFWFVSCGADVFP